VRSTSEQSASASGVIPEASGKPTSKRTLRNYIQLIEHPKREELDRDVLSDRPIKFLADKYGATTSAIKKYQSLLNQKTGMAMTERSLEQGEYVLDNIESVMNRLRSMLDACDEWLRDPDEPHKYNLNPRSFEVEVIYEEESKKPTKESKTVRRKALLSELLRQSGKDAVEIRYKHADPRQILTTVADSVERQLRLLSQIQGKIKTNTDEVTTLVLVKIQQTVINELKEHPQLRKKIADAFDRL
jgi:hypothetical protein